MDLMESPTCKPLVNTSWLGLVDTGVRVNTDRGGRGLESRLKVTAVLLPVGDGVQRLQKLHVSFLVLKVALVG